MADLLGRRQREIIVRVVQQVTSGIHPQHISVTVATESKTTSVIALYMETLRNPAKFRAAALKAARAGKPVVAFKVGRYDRRFPLIIDPVLIFSTYLGGSGGHSIPNAIATDSSGAAYVGGHTASLEFPTTPGAFQETGIAGDGFVSKFDASGALVYSTYFGGYGTSINAIAVSPTGEAYVAGSTSALDFPTTDGAFQRTCVVSELYLPVCHAGFKRLN